MGQKYRHNLAVATSESIAYHELATWPFNISYLISLETITRVSNIFIHCRNWHVPDWCLIIWTDFMCSLFHSMPLYNSFPSLSQVINRCLSPMGIWGCHDSVTYWSYLSYMMPKLYCAVDCGKIAAATIAVTTPVGVEDSGPPTAQFN